VHVIHADHDDGDTAAFAAAFARRARQAAARALATRQELDEQARRRRRLLRHGPLDLATFVELVDDELACFARLLDVAPVQHTDWPALVPVPAGVAELACCAIESALFAVHGHEGVPGAMVTMHLAERALELSVLDGGWPPAGAGTSPPLLIDGLAASGVDVYPGQGTCQWWIIPVDRWMPQR
jgi:hypothetical protein